MSFLDLWGLWCILGAGMAVGMLLMLAQRTLRRRQHTRLLQVGPLGRCTRRSKRVTQPGPTKRDLHSDSSSLQRDEAARDMPRSIPLTASSSASALQALRQGAGAQPFPPLTIQNSLVPGEAGRPQEPWRGDALQEAAEQGWGPGAAGPGSGPPGSTSSGSAAKEAAATAWLQRGDSSKQDQGRAPGEGTPGVPPAAASPNGLPANLLALSLPGSPHRGSPPVTPRSTSSLSPAGRRRISSLQTSGLVFEGCERHWECGSDSRPKPASGRARLASSDRWLSIRSAPG